MRVQVGWALAVLRNHFDPAEDVSEFLRPDSGEPLTAAEAIRLLEELDPESYLGDAEEPQP